MTPAVMVPSATLGLCAFLIATNALDVGDTMNPVALEVASVALATIAAAIKSAARNVEMTVKRAAQMVARLASLEFARAVSALNILLVPKKTSFTVRIQMNCLETLELRSLASSKFSGILCLKGKSALPLNLEVSDARETVTTVGRASNLRS